MYEYVILIIVFQEIINFQSMWFNRGVRVECIYELNFWEKLLKWESGDIQTKFHKREKAQKNY